MIDHRIQRTDTALAVLLTSACTSHRGLSVIKGKRRLVTPSHRMNKHVKATHKDRRTDGACRHRDTGSSGRARDT